MKKNLKIIVLIVLLFGSSIFSSGNAIANEGTLIEENLENKEELSKESD